MLMFDLSHLPDTSFTFGTSKRDSQLQGEMPPGREDSAVYGPQPKGKESKKIDSCKQCLHAARRILLHSITFHTYSDPRVAVGSDASACGPQMVTALKVSSSA